MVTAPQIANTRVNKAIIIMPYPVKVCTVPDTASPVIVPNGIVLCRTPPGRKENPTAKDTSIANNQLKNLIGCLFMKFFFAIFKPPFNQFSNHLNIHLLNLLKSHPGTKKLNRIANIR